MNPSLISKLLFLLPSLICAVACGGGSDSDDDDDGGDELVCQAGYLKSADQCVPLSVAEPSAALGESWSLGEGVTNANGQVRFLDEEVGLDLLLTAADIDGEQYAPEADPGSECEGDDCFLRGYVPQMQTELIYDSEAYLATMTDPNGEYYPFLRGSAPDCGVRGLADCGIRGKLTGSVGQAAGLEGVMKMTRQRDRARENLLAAQDRAIRHFYFDRPDPTAVGDYRVSAHQLRALFAKGAKKGLWLHVKKKGESELDFLDGEPIGPEEFPSVESLIASMGPVFRVSVIGENLPAAGDGSAPLDPDRLTGPLGLYVTHPDPDPDGPLDFDDYDQDGWGDAVDNCPQIPNEDQHDVDGDQVGDACESDVPVCGNGKVEHPETCDDGNRNDGDGCDRDCRSENTLPPGSLVSKIIVLGDPDDFDPIYGSPALDSQGRLYFRTQGGDHYSFETVTNGSLWYADLGGSDQGALSIDEEAGVFYTTRDSASAYTLQPIPQQTWLRFSNWVGGTAAFGDGGVFWISYSQILGANASDGSSRWVLETGTDYNGAGSPSIGADGTVYAGAHDGYLYALDPVTGSVRWMFDTGSPIYTTPAIGADNVVYFSSDNRYTYAVQGSDGALVWSVELGASSGSPTIGKNNRLYVGSYDRNLYALDASTGAELWRFETRDNGGFPRSGVAGSASVGDNGTVYFGALDFSVYALNGATGEMYWEYKTEWEVFSSPAIGPDGTVYIGSNDGNLYAISGASPGLCRDCPWPKLHHDNANSGRYGYVAP